MKNPQSSIYPFGKYVGNLAWVKATVVAGTGIYQRYLSPHKGFSCAHRRLYGGASCSEYFRQAVSVYGVFDALPRLQRRFTACGEANRILRSQTLSSLAGNNNSSSSDKQRQRQRRDRPRYCRTRPQTNEEILCDCLCGPNNIWDCCSLTEWDSNHDGCSCDLGNCSDCSGCDVSDCGSCGN